MQIDRRAGLTPLAFQQEYVVPGRPVVLTDLGRDWPALQRWTFDALRTRGRDTEVRVEMGNAVQGNEPRYRMTMAKYIDLLESGEASKRKLYLAGLDLLGEFPDMARDVNFDILGPKRLHYRRAWIGAAGTGSGFHRDIGDNVLAQVVGEKIVRLASPADDACMYESDRFDFLTYVSEVDADHWDAARHPRFADADIGEVVLRAGEGVFIPTNWWHFTRSVDNGVGINCGGMTIVEALRAWRHFAEYALHVAHLYRWGNCLCHPSVIDAPDAREGRVSADSG